MKQEPSKTHNSGNEHMDGGINESLYELRKTLTENTSLLARIEERLKNFVERVDIHEAEIEDMKLHVQAVRTVSKIVACGLAALTTMATIFKIFKS